MVIERLVISLIKNDGYAVCAVCRATSVRHLTPRLLSNRFTPCSHFFRPKVLGFHFCGASRVVAHFSVTHFPRGAIPGRWLMVSNLAPSSCHSKPPFGEVAIRNNPWYFCQVLRYNIRYTRFIKNVVKMQWAFCFNNFILITQYPCLN